MRIRRDGSDQLRASRRDHLARPVHRLVPQGLLPAAQHNGLLPPREVPLHLLVQHPVHRRLRGTEVARAHAAVQAREALLPQDLARAVQAVPVLPLRRAAALLRDVLVELQPRLDHPDGVRRRRRHDPRRRRRRQVHPRGLAPAVEVLCDDALPVAVGVEVDGAGGDDADEVGAQALEEGAGPLDAVDRRQDLERLGEVVHRGAEGCEGLEVRARAADLRLVEVGLQAGLEDVEGRRQGRGRHAANAGVPISFPLWGWGAGKSCLPSRDEVHP